MIKFPRMHIAKSVVNRILNIADQSEQPGAPDLSQPRVPDTGRQSVQLDAALSAPMPDLPGIDQAPSPGDTLGGAPLIATMLNPQQ